MHVALFLAYLEEKEGNKIDREFLLKRIMFNSLSGLILSDINSGTRDYILQIDNEVFGKIESKAFDTLHPTENTILFKKAKINYNYEWDHLKQFAIHQEEEFYMSYLLP